MHALAFLLLIPGSPIDDRPPMSDLARFPNEALALEASARNVRFLRWCQTEAALYLHRKPLLDVVIVETVRLGAAWEMLGQAHYHETWDLDAARDDLDQLRAVLGSADYALGRMPPAIPWWRVAERD